MMIYHGKHGPFAVTGEMHEDGTLTVDAQMDYSGRHVQYERAAHLELSVPHLGGHFNAATEWLSCFDSAVTVWARDVAKAWREGHRPAEIERPAFEQEPPPVHGATHSFRNALARIASRRKDRR